MWRLAGGIGKMERFGRDGRMLWWGWRDWIATVFVYRGIEIWDVCVWEFGFCEVVKGVATRLGKKVDHSRYPGYLPLLEMSVGHEL